MDSGFYAACAGLRAQTLALDIIANNLANVNTSGYRAQQPSFASWLQQARSVSSPLNAAINDYSVVGSTHVNTSPGNLEHTGNPLDVAIEGDGFLVVQSRVGTLYTRGGNLHVSPQGALLSSSGDPVLGSGGPVQLPPGPVSISTDGTISVNGAVAGRLRLVEFDAGASLIPAGGVAYETPAQALPAASSYIRQGMLESSNVSAVEAMAGLIAVQRRAEMLHRAMSMYYGEFNRIAAQELSRV